MAEDLIPQSITEKGVAAPPTPADASGLPPAEPPSIQDQEHVPHANSFWQQKWVQDVLPFATSVVFHIGIVVLVIATAKTVQAVKQVIEEQIIIPDATIVEGGEVGGIPNPGLGGDPTRAAAQDQFEDVPADSTGWSDKPSETLNQTLAGGGEGEPSSGAIGFSAAGGGFGGKGDRIGSGSGDGSGPAAPFGVPGGGGGLGPKSPFMGISGNAKRVAYVCDASGSMMGKLLQLKTQIERAVDVLKPIQAFNIIFFSQGTATALDNGQLVMANAENKRKAYDFLKQVTTRANTDPIPGLEIAFKQKPQLIYLLTDGDFPDNEAVLKRIAELNSDKSVKINTILFVSSRDLKEAPTQFATIQGLLKKIADDNGGTFKTVGDDDLY